MTQEQSYPGSVVAQLKSLRERVTGVTEGIVSSADGLLVAADVATVQPESLAALAATSLALGKRTAAEAGLNGLRETVTRANGGYVVVLAIGDNALMAIVGDEGLDLAGLYREGPITVEALDKILAARE
jgi:uncharacterized protein